MIQHTATTRKTKRYIVIFFWLIIVGIAFGINYSSETRAQNDLAFQTARAFFDQIVFSRAWNAGYGGVYVPVSEDTQPNSYLDDPLRDLTTIEGIKLTKINPAYMTRQIAEIASREKRVQFHITSLQPIRPANKPLDWEKVWLELFEKGIVEKGGFVQNGSDVSFRYMAPLITKRNCLKCHAKQGYKIGDIRGGISVTLPFLSKANSLMLILGYGAAAFLGTIAIYVAGHMLGKEEGE
jgi:hypothetical protein